MRTGEENTIQTTIDLLRHGEPVGGAGRYRGHTDDPLSEAGWQQMWAAVDGAPRWDLIVSSPLLRCHDFARQLAERTGIPCEIAPDLCELHFGDWEGKSWQEVQDSQPQQVQAFWRDPFRHPPPGGESLQVFARRVRSGHAALWRRHAGKHMLYVIHGGVIRVLLQEILAVPDHRLLSLEVSWACLSRLHYQGLQAPKRQLLFHGGRP